MSFGLANAPAVFQACARFPSPTDHAWSHIAVDFVTRLPPSNGNNSQWANQDLEATLRCVMESHWASTSKVSSEVCHHLLPPLVINLPSSLARKRKCLSPLSRPTSADVTGFGEPHMLPWTTQPSRISHSQTLLIHTDSLHTSLHSSCFLTSPLATAIRPLTLNTLDSVFHSAQYSLWIKPLKLPCRLCLLLGPQ